MMLLKRPAPPPVLVRNSSKWTKVYQERLKTSSTLHPDSKKYAHKEVVASLERMSFHKCFYCEKKLKDGVRHQVEHYRDVADRPDLSFEWSNLYLTCEDCNLGKPSNADLPVEVCLDPCGKIAPSRHLRFDDEIVTAVRGSKRGLNTIRKYRLDRDELDLARIRTLRRIDAIVHELSRLAQKYRRKSLPPAFAEALDELHSLASADAPFSLMCAAYARKSGFLRR